MDKKRVEEIMQSHGVINVIFDGMPVWIEGIRGDLAEVTLINASGHMDAPIDKLTES